MPDGQAGMQARYAHAADAVPREAAAAEELPNWDLSDLYPGPDSAALAEDLSRAEAAAKQFSADFAGLLGGLPGAELATAIARYERIEEILGRVMSYAQLLFSGDSSNAEIGRFYQTMS